jgi:hypothetical protein
MKSCDRSLAGVLSTIFARQNTISSGLGRRRSHSLHRRKILQQVVCRPDTPGAYDYALVKCTTNILIKNLFFCKAGECTNRKTGPRESIRYRIPVPSRAWQAAQRIVYPGRLIQGILQYIHLNLALVLSSANTYACPGTKYLVGTGRYIEQEFSMTMSLLLNYQTHQTRQLGRCAP